MKKYKESRISRNFIISIAAVYCILILVTALLFNLFLKVDSGIIEDAIMKNSEEVLIDKTLLLKEKLAFYSADYYWKLKKLLRQLCTPEKKFLHVIIYAKTADDNYFRVMNTIPVDKRLKVALKPGSTVMEEKDINYLRRGLLNMVVEPRIYSQGCITWQNIYAPYTMSRKKLVMQFMMSTSSSHNAVKKHHANVIMFRRIMIALTVLLITAVIIVTLLFVHNYSLLIQNLSLYMDKAAHGDHDLNLNSTADEELNQLAHSFNSLMDEIKEMKERGPAEEDPFKDIFKTGVTLLKDDRLNEAAAIFTALTILKPGGFGSYFNLGIIYAKMKRFTDSLENFNKALETNPSYEITHSYIAKVKKMMSS